MFKYNSPTNSENSQKENDFSFNSLFVPLTTIKAIHILVILGFLVFGNMLFNQFAWDDISYIIENAEVHTFNITSAFQQNLFNNASQYRAFAVLYFSMLYSLFGTYSFFYHFVQLVIHIVNAILVYLLFKEFFRPKLAVLLASIFLVHPIQVESVSYISAAGGILFFFFGIIALLILKKQQLTLKDWLIVSFLFFSSLLFKETGILFITVGFIYLLFFNRKFFLQYIGFCSGILFIYFLIRIGVGGVMLEPRTMIPIAQLSFIERLINVPQILLFYLKMFFIPNPLVYQHWIISSVTVNTFYIPLFTLLSIFTMLVFVFLKFINNKKTERKIFVFFLVWLTSGLALHSQIFPLDMTVADRWMYFPSVGFLGLIGSMIVCVPNLKKNVKLVSILLIIVIVALSVRTIIRNEDWKDSITLFTHDIKFHTNFFIENDLAQNLMRAGNRQEALSHQLKSVTLFPTEQNLLNLADIYEKEGNIPEARKYYTLALQSSAYMQGKYKHLLVTYIKFGGLLVKHGEPKEAVVVINQGLNDYNDYQYRAYLLVLSALANYELGKSIDGANALQEAYQLIPDARILELSDKLQKNEQIDVPYYLKIIP